MKRKRDRYVKCRCVTRWIVDFGDERGEQPVPALTAALASGVGLRVRLGPVSTSPTWPQIIAGLSYSGSTTYVSKVCDVCGFPTRIAKRTGTFIGLPIARIAAG